MADPLLPVITDAGIAAAFAADALGTHVSIHEVAIGDVGWTPDSTATALQSEQVREGVAGGSNPAPNQVHLAALFDGPEEFWIREIGFYLEDDTLFAVWSHATDVIGYKSALADFLLTLDLVLSVIPPGSVTIETTEDALSVGLAADLAALTARVDVIEPVYTVAQDLPLSPNRIYGSKRFPHLCGGDLNTPESWDEGGLAAPWSAAWFAGASGDVVVEVVDATDDTRLTALGLWPLGDLGSFGDGGNTGFYIAVLDLQLAAAPAVNKACFFIELYDRFGATHGSAESNGARNGEVRTQMSWYLNVLAMDADLRVNLSDVGNILVPADVTDLGQGWQYKYASGAASGHRARINFINDVTFASPASATIAFALPYHGYGDHGGLKRWTEATEDIIDDLA